MTTYLVIYSNECPVNGKSEGNMELKAENFEEAMSKMLQKIIDIERINEPEYSDECIKGIQLTVVSKKPWPKAFHCKIIKTDMPTFDQ